MTYETGYYRVKDDTDDGQRGRFWNPKAKRSRALPEPYRLTSIQGNSNVVLDDRALGYLALVNDQDLQKIHYVLRPQSGIVNYGAVDYSAKIVDGKISFKFKGKERPKFEYVVFGNSIVYVNKVDGNRLFVQMLEVGSIMPNGKFFPPVQRFRSIDEFDNLATLPYNAVMFCRAGDSCFLPANRLEFIGRPVVKSPEELLPYLVKVTVWSLRIRSGPSIEDTIVGGLSSFLGSTRTVTQLFYDKGGNVWGRISEGWIALKYGGQHMTDWKV